MINKLKQNNFWLAIFLATTFVWLNFQPPHFVHGQSNAIVEIGASVPNPNVKAGDTFDLNIMVNVNVENRAAQAGVTFDPKLVEVVDGVEGDYYKNWADANAATTMMLPTDISFDNAAGKVAVTGVALTGAPRQGPTGNGILYTLHMKAKENGTVKFKLVDVKIYDTGANDPSFKPVLFENIQVKDLDYTIGSNNSAPKATVVSQNPTAVATVVRKTVNDLSDNSSDNSIPWIIIVPVIGVALIGGFGFFFLRKK